MIALWMLYATIVSSAVVFAAAGLERACRVRRRPARIVWVAGLAAGLGVCAWSLRPRARPETILLAPQSPSTARGIAAPVVPERPAAVEIESAPLLPRVSELPVPRDWPLDLLDRVTLAAWAIASLGWLGSLVGAGLLLRRRAARWTPTTVDGARVLVAPDFGPGVIGALRAHIVLPRWALALGPERQALILAHEREHVRVRDALLILASGVAVGIAPWNLALWYMRTRLRAAIEVDCDARVLAQHPDVEAYGALLIDVGERAPSDMLLVAGLSEAAAALRRRIQLMTAPRARFAGAQASACVAAALLALVVACATPRPGAPPAVPSIVVAPVADSNVVAVSALEDTIQAQSARIHDLEAQLKARDTARDARAALRVELDSTRAALAAAIRTAMDAAATARVSVEGLDDSADRGSRKGSTWILREPRSQWGRVELDSETVRELRTLAGPNAPWRATVDSARRKALIVLRDFSEPGVGVMHWRIDSLSLRRMGETADHVALDAELRATRREIEAMQRELALEREAMARVRQEFEAERDSTRAALKAALSGHDAKPTR